jgi:hypothetical protein
MKGNAKDKKYPFAVGPVVLAFFLFVVLGSSILEIIMSIGRGPT